MDECSFSFKTSGEGALTTCKKSNIFCEIDKGTVRLYDSRLQLSEETFRKILSNCQSERDVADWWSWPKSRHHFQLGRGDRLYRSDSHLEQKEISATTSAHGRFPLNIRNLSWTFGYNFVISPDNPGHFCILMISIAWSQQTQDWFLETRIYQVIKARDN